MQLELMPFLEAAADAARAAGGVALGGWDRSVRVSAKGFRDLVTDYDVRCQQVIKSMIAARFPEHGFLAEEADTMGDREAEYRWIIDPIDGTTNYARHYPTFSISIALARESELLVGVVFDPLRNDVFAALRGQGARRNGQPIQVSERDSLGTAILGTEWAREDAARRLALRLLAGIGAEVQTIRTTGSAALSLCYLAAGWTDVYFNMSLQAWDIAAGTLIIEEAGGRVTDLDGRPRILAPGPILASNGFLHTVALEALKVEV